MMTPDEHAEWASAELDREGLSPASAADAPRVRAVIADAVHAAVAEEREACAARVEAAALRWPDEPQIAAVLRREADAIRARGRNGGAGA
jgi:hypothetical protein